MDPRKMNRIQLLDELRRHAHPTWYHQLLAWPTAALKGLLVYYQEDDEPKVKTVHITINL